MMTEWWHGLSGAEQVFWAIAIFFTTLLLIQFALSIVGADIDSDVEVDDLDAGDASFDADFSLFSFRSIIAFFTFFGWGGLLVLGEGGGLTSALLVAVIAGFAAMFTVAYMMLWFSKMSQSGTLDMSAALLSEGEVYLTIPGRRSGVGKIHLTIGNTLRELDAVTESDTIPNGTPVRVLDILNENVLLVEPLKSLR